MTRNFSAEQNAYMMAKAYYETVYKQSRDYDKLMDAECVKLGLLAEGDAYGILPEGHPMWTEAQRLLDRENEARDLMRSAACLLFDWATETTLAKKGTPKQKQEIRAMVSKVKQMAHVERPWEELSDLCLKLAV